MHSRRPLVLLAVALVGSLVPSVAAAQPPPLGPSTTVDPAEQRTDTRSRRGQVRAEVDALRATDGEIQASLRDLSGRIDAQRAAVAAAEESASQATSAAEAAAAAEVAAREEAARTKDQVKQMAIEAYLNPPSEQLATVLVAGSILEAKQRQSVLSVRAKQRGELLERRRAALGDLQAKARQADAARSEAEAARVAQTQTLSELQSSQQQKASLASAIDRRIEASLAEAAALDRVDRALSFQIAVNQALLRQQVEQVGKGPLSPGPVAVPVNVPPTPDKPSLAPPPPRAVPPPPPLVGPGDIVPAGPFQVHRAIADAVTRMLAAASAAGFALGGGGYRDSASQIALRRANCGPTDYDIYVRPASECSPPTARPGSSMHEQGLALDLTCNGPLITTQGDPCFLWLAQNAATYGLYNLPSEPWHWSVNGN